MPSAVASASEIMTHTSSLSMVRNMIRLNFCGIAYARGLFPEDCFRTQSIHGLNLKTLGGKRECEQSQMFMSWVENGVFDALNQGFLERCVLVVTSESGKALECWSLSVKWLTDENGIKYAQLQQESSARGVDQNLKDLRTKESVKREARRLPDPLSHARSFHAHL